MSTIRTSNREAVPAKDTVQPIKVYTLNPFVAITLLLAGIAIAFAAGV